MIKPKQTNQNRKFYDPGGKGSCAEVWPYKSYSENALFFFKNLLLLGIYGIIQFGLKTDLCDKIVKNSARLGTENCKKNFL